MPDPYSDPSQQFFSDLGTRMRDVEEKHKLLKDRILLIGQNLVSEREETFKDLQDMKKTIIKLKEENLRMKEVMQLMSEQLTDLARREELMILKRQFDMLKPHVKHKKD